MYMNINAVHAEQKKKFHWAGHVLRTDTKKTPLTHFALGRCVIVTFLCQNICKENSYEIHNKDRLHSNFN